MIRRHLPLLSLLVAPAFASNAQDAPSTSDSTFCELRDESLALALEGSWSITQGGGTAIGGFIPVPLPSHGAKPIVFHYDSTSGMLNASDPNGTLVMAMFPTRINPFVASETLIGEKPADVAGSPRYDCEWQELPILIGSNDYSGYHSGTTESPVTKYGGTNLVKAVYCPFIRQIVPEEDYACNDPLGAPIKSEGDLNMVMTLVLRFLSTSHAVGHLYFIGEEEGYKYGATAPVTVSR